MEKIDKLNKTIESISMELILLKQDIRTIEPEIEEFSKFKDIIKNKNIK